MSTLDGYLGAVVGRLQGIFRGRLVGVYPAGSLAFDAYAPGRSDIDLVAVAERPTAAEIAAVTAALDHRQLPCPAAGLEFVLYDRSVLAGLSTEAGFALNLNTGARLAYKAETHPGDGPAFWYPIDRDIVRQQRRALIGPPFADLVTRVRSRVLLPVVAESVAVQLAGLGEHGDNAVLNGCRALRYHAEHAWSPKRAAAAWAAERLPADAPVIRAALAGHARGRGAGDPPGDASEPARDRGTGPARSDDAGPARERGTGLALGDEAEPAAVAFLTKVHAILIAPG